MKEKFQRFMKDRYGIDQLYVGLLIFYFFLLFLSRWVYPAVMSSLMAIVIVVVIFRIFSKNLTQRRKENTKYLKIVNNLKRKLSGGQKRLKDMKTKRYRKCPSCGVTLRLERKKGEHHVKCPKCNTSTTFTIKR